jgi:hypothetical protein
MAPTATEHEGRLGAASSIAGAVLLQLAAAMLVGCTAEFRALDPALRKEGGSDAPTTSDVAGMDAGDGSRAAVRAKLNVPNLASNASFTLSRRV